MAITMGTLLIGAATLLYWPVAVTQLDLGTDAPIQCRFTEPEWRLAWLHSVEKTPWIETYQRLDGYFLLGTTQFKSFGAGTPTQGKILPAPPGYVAYEVNLRLPELNWVVSRRVRSTLWLGDAAWPIFEWVPDHTEAHFRPTYAPLWRTLIKDFCHEQ